MPSKNKTNSTPPANGQQYVLYELLPSDAPNRSKEVMDVAAMAILTSPGVEPMRGEPYRYGDLFLCVTGSREDLRKAERSARRAVRRYATGAKP